MVADDQKINLEMMQTHLTELGVYQKCSVCVDGQQAINRCKELIDAALRTNSEELEIMPVSLCLLDF